MINSLTLQAKRALFALTAAGALIFAGAANVSAYNYSSYYQNNTSSSSGRAISYINPDIGAPTANNDVDPTSSCSKPDRYDTQKLSAVGSTANNVHNDACFLAWENNSKLDGPASFVSSGVGVISGCPDPDGAGPKTATLSADKKRCFQTGYQDKNAAGDDEFHARLNNSTTAGTQTVVWCSDSDNDGCDDEWNKSTIRINWVR